ncbi:MAG TPA: hypothetical protein VLS85_03865, partial [Hanamia sp.]|nr:hypothetical protein [Hanamia sp.]
MLKCKNCPSSTIVLFILLLLQQSAFAQTKYHKLIWSDEFNHNGAPDNSKWDYELGAGGWGNNELEYYTSRPQNVMVKDGVLK